MLKVARNQCSHYQRVTWDPNALMLAVQCALKCSIDAPYLPRTPCFLTHAYLLSSHLCIGVPPPHPYHSLLSHSRDLWVGERQMRLALPQSLDDDLVRRRPLLARPFHGVCVGTLRVRAIDPTWVRPLRSVTLGSRCKQHSSAGLCAVSAVCT